MPKAYGQLTGLVDFPAALDVFGQGEWSEFFTVAETPQQVSRTRPFYPRTSTAASRQAHLLDGLGLIGVDALLRQCDRATPIRRRACPLFWTLGGNQVGRAAISGWQDVIAPARRRGARLWPFDGDLARLATIGIPVLAETYPAEAYRHADVTFLPSMRKRRQEDRRAATAGLLEWAARRNITFSADLVAHIQNGFGARRDGEDAFDALIGLLGMIEVTDGRRAEYPADREHNEVWEGWILGQAG